MISVNIIADSINAANGKRITSLIAKYPRFIHAEVMTHRMLSKNSASSRAIPINKIISFVEEEPAMPEFWGKNQKGMQAMEALDVETANKALKVWLEARDAAVSYAKKLQELDVHKQITNRILEPFCHMTVLITGTEWGNFFNLRAHKDAQPEFQVLAFEILQKMHQSTPKLLNQGEWHLPFGNKFATDNLTAEQLLKISTARAARVSYVNFEGTIDYDKDYQLHDSLLKSKHMSPFEHSAMAVDDLNFYGNFQGWKQYRKCLEGENMSVYNAEELLKNRPNGKNS